MSTTSSPNNDVLSSDHHHYPPGPSGVLDVVIKNGFVIPVKLQFQHRQQTLTELQSQTRLETKDEEEGDNNTELSPHVEASQQTIYLTPCTTVTDLKHLIHQRYGIEPKNQRLRLMLVGDQQQQHLQEEDEDGRDEDGGDGRRRDSRPIFYGQFLDSLQQQQQQQQSMTVSVEDVPVDPTWQAFYDMTGYDDWRERDQITQYMCRGRDPQHCPEGSPLVEGTTRFPCFKCGHDLTSEAVRRIHPGGEIVQIVPMVSTLSNEDDVGDDDPPPFVLCTRCYAEDTGTPELGTDPYRYIFDLSLEMGRRLTSISCGFGCFRHRGYPIASLNSSQIEFSNNKMRPQPTEPVVIPEGASPEEITQIRRRHKKDSIIRPHQPIGFIVEGGADQVVIPTGVRRVVVKLRDDQRQALIKAGHGDKLSSVEIYRQNSSLSSRDVVRFRESISRRQNEELWDAIKMHIQSQSQLFEEPHFYPHLKLATYEVDQVLFELSVKYVENYDY